MIKKISLILTLILVFTMSFSFLYAAQEYTFEIQYEGDIVENVKKDAKVLLIGKNGTLHENALIRVSVSGPGTPTILATDSANNEYDIAKLGTWGPPSGFPVRGDFTNVTPVRATFPVAGVYTIKLDLIDANNNQTVYTTKTINLTIVKEKIEDENGTKQEENEITTLPQTGRTYGEYLIYAIAGIFLISFIIFLFKKKCRV